MIARVTHLAVWCFAVWVLLTWTLTAEQLLVGAGISLAVALCLAPMGPVVSPWLLVHPRRLGVIVALAARVLGGILFANLRLTRRIWARRPLVSSGMVVVPTDMRTEGGVALTGLLTSLMVDNQIVDLDRGRGELLYHAVTVPEGDASAAYDEINGPVERLLARLESR